MNERNMINLELCKDVHVLFIPETLDTLPVRQARFTTTALV